MSDGLVTPAEYARRRGVSRQAVSKAIKAGRLTLINGMVDPVAADQQWSGSTDVARRMLEPAPPAPEMPAETPGKFAQSEPKPDPGKVVLSPAQQQYASSRAVREAYNALTAKHEYEETLGKLVRADDVRLAAFNAGRKARSLLETLPTSCCDMLVGRDAADIRRLLAEEVRRICAEVDKWALSPL